MPSGILPAPCRRPEQLVILFRRQPVDDRGLDAEVAAPRTALLRGRLAVLCLLLLGLGVADAVRFRLTHIETLTTERDQARAQLDALGAEPEAPPPPPLPAETDSSRAADSAPAIAAHPSPWVAARRQLHTAAAAARRGWARLGAIGLGLATVAGVLVYLRRRLRTAAAVSNAATVMILVLGVLLLSSRLMAAKAIPDLTALGIVDLVVIHLAVCLVMPWSPREATLPFAPLLLIWAITFLVPGASDLDITDRVVGIIASPMLLAPGLGIAAWRQRRRREDVERRILEGRVLSYGGELSRARIVHDAMFPRPFTGHIEFEYEYQPIHEIGGDYVHAYVNPETGGVTLTLLDVAGHGLAAALTVNRLFGELERILAEDADAEPGQVMTLLNRYIYLTMAPHSMYATGTCMTLDPRTGDLTWASAGHPPSLVRRADGRVEELPTTSVLLGAFEPEVFDPGQARARLRPGEVAIAYTDGAFEARDGSGTQFGLKRVQETARFDPPPRSWPKFIAGAVAQHHAGHAEDDVLIASLKLRSLRVADVPAASRATRAAIAAGRVMTPAAHGEMA